MKNSNIIVNIIFGAAIILLFVLYVKTPKAEKPQETPVSVESEPAPVETAEGSSSFPIAYVNVDSVMHNYVYYQTMEHKYETLVKNAESALQKKAEKFQKEVEDFQYQVQNRIITSADAQAKEAELTNRQQSLMMEQQQKQQDLAQQEQKMLSQLIDSLKVCINNYNADGKYKIILNNAYQSSVLYAEEQLNITQDILDVMNARYAVAKTKK